MVGREGIRSIRDVPYPNANHVELLHVRCQKRLLQSLTLALKLSQSTTSHVSRFEKTGLVKLERILTIYEKSLSLLRHVDYECILQHSNASNLAELFKVVQPKFVDTIQHILRNIKSGILHFFTNNVSLSPANVGDRQFNSDLETSVHLIGNFNRLCALSAKHFSNNLFCEQYISYQNLLSHTAESRMQLMYKDQHPIKTLTIYYQNKLLDSASGDLKLKFADSPYHPKLNVKLDVDTPSDVKWRKEDIVQPVQVLKPYHFVVYKHAALNYSENKIQSAFDDVVLTPDGCKKYVEAVIATEFSFIRAITDQISLIVEDKGYNIPLASMIDLSYPTMQEPQTPMHRESRNIIDDDAVSYTSLARATVASHDDDPALPQPEFDIDVEKLFFDGRKHKYHLDNYYIRYFNTRLGLEINGGPPDIVEQKLTSDTDRLQVPIITKVMKSVRQATKRVTSETFSTEIRNQDINETHPCRTVLFQNVHQCIRLLIIMSYNDFCSHSNLAHLIADDEPSAMNSNQDVPEPATVYTDALLLNSDHSIAGLIAYLNRKIIENDIEEQHTVASQYNYSKIPNRLSVFDNSDNDSILSAVSLLSMHAGRKPYMESDGLDGHAEDYTPVFTNHKNVMFYYIRLLKFLNNVIHSKLWELTRQSSLPTTCILHNEVLSMIHLFYWLDFEHGYCTNRFGKHIPWNDAHNPLHHLHLSENTYYLFTKHLVLGLKNMLGKLTDYMRSEVEDVSGEYWKSSSKSNKTYGVHYSLKDNSKQQKAFIWSKVASLMIRRGSVNDIGKGSGTVMENAIGNILVPALAVLEELNADTRISMMNNFIGILLNSYLEFVKLRHKENAKKKKSSGDILKQLQADVTCLQNWIQGIPQFSEDEKDYMLSQSHFQRYNAIVASLSQSMMQFNVTGPQNNPPKKWPKNINSKSQPILSRVKKNAVSPLPMSPDSDSGHISDESQWM